MDVDARPRGVHGGGVLADVLVAIAVLGVLMSANLLFLQQGERVYRFGAARVESQQTARIALTRVARELRTAGSGPVDPASPAISVAQAGRVVLHRDWDQDGAIAGPRDTVTWFLDGTILRRDAGGGAQPIVNGVRGLVFEYFDGSGAVTTIPGEVRSVRITVTAEAGGVQGVTTRMSTQVRLRNR